MQSDSIEKNFKIVLEKPENKWYDLITSKESQRN